MSGGISGHRKISKIRPKIKAHTRIVSLGGRKFLTSGLKTPIFGDLYHRAMTVSWPLFFGGFAAIFLVANTLFALIYNLGSHPIANARMGGLTDLFFFSIETLATVGYGDMHPQTVYAHLVATVEIFTGMSGLAVVTGLVFARFSRPQARLLFAQRAVIGPHDGNLCLMVRVANERHDVILEASAKLWVLLEEETVEGLRLRRFHELPLERSESPVFALSWTLFHVIEEGGRLHGLEAGDFEDADAALIVTLSGVDENSGQKVNGRSIYSHTDVRWNHRYVDVLGVGPDGVPISTTPSFTRRRPSTFYPHRWRRRPTAAGDSWSCLWQICRRLA